MGPKGDGDWMEQIEAKRILQRKRDKSWFGSSYNVNLYRGCPHGCIYCDSRSRESASFFTRTRTTSSTP